MSGRDPDKSRTDEDPLRPILSDMAISLLREHAKAIWATAEDEDDRVLATSLELLLVNHDRRAAALKAINS